MIRRILRRESVRFSRYHLLAVVAGLALVACSGNDGGESFSAGGRGGIDVVPPGSGGTSSGGATAGSGATADTAGASASGAAMNASGGSAVADGGAAGSSGSGGTIGTSDGGGSAGADGATAPATTCMGKLGAPRLTARTITGYNVLVYIPPTVDPNTAVPLLLVHHGFLMDGEAMRTLTNFQAIADREGFVVAFPTGLGNTWNIGANACGGAALVTGTADDLTLVSTMISTIEADQCISREHVFMTGFSMGGYFANHVGCQMSDVVHGIAPHSGGTYPGSCPGGPIPVMIWHGSADGTVPPDCGRTSRDYWVERNGCQATVDSVPVLNGTCEWNQGCPPGGQVVLCMMNNMNHQWSGGSGLIGAPNYENASEMIWAFFKSQSGL